VQSSEYDTLYMAVVTTRTVLTNTIVGLIGFGLGILLVHVAGWDDISLVASAIPIMMGVVIAPILVRAWTARREKS
jgi:hypothetical protein